MPASIDPERLPADSATSVDGHTPQKQRGPVTLRRRTTGPRCFWGVWPSADGAVSPDRRSGSIEAGIGQP